MYDPKFEKAIQQKMEELEFRPAESVWVNIEKAVVVKRRRRAGYYWRFLLPGVFLAGITGAYILYHGQALDHGQGAAPAAKLPASAAASAPVVPVQEKGSAMVSEPAAGNPPVPSPALNMPSAMARTIERSGSHPAIAATTGDAKIAWHGVGQRTKGQADRIGNDDPDVGSTASPDAQPLTAQNRVAEWFYLPGLADQKFGAGVQGAALKTKKTSMISLTKLSHPQRHWEAGFVAGGGWSKLNRLNADMAKKALSAGATSLYAIASPSSSKHYISNITPGASFDGGIYLQRALSDRWIFNTGMNLHFYSNHISVGQQLATNVPVSASLFIPTAATAVTQTTTSTMYSAGNAQHFTNRYYFLELPVGLQWKVTKSHTLPIFLEGGVSLSRLMGASALFYNAKTGLYSKDAEVVGKTQFNVSSSLMVGLPVHGIAVEVGPQVQYGLTSLVNTQGLGDQHLFYAGLRVVVIPGRK